VVAVDQHRQVELAGDVATVLDVKALHLLALRAGLVGDQRHAEHPLGFGFTASIDLTTLTPPPLPRPPA
jgi:hypothetical protein